MSAAAEFHRRLRDVFIEVFEDPEFSMEPIMKMGDIEPWNSFAHINLMLAIEAEFEIEFDSDEIGALLSVGDITTALHRRLNIDGR